MKKITAILAVVVLYFSFVIASAEVSTKAFDLALTKQFKQFGYYTTVSSIMEDESSRSSRLTHEQSSQ